MKIAIAADPHFMGKDFALQLKGWRAMLFNMKEEDASWVVVAGDMFDRATIGDKYVSTEAMLSGVLQVIEEVGLPIIILEGNHDWTGNPDQVRALSLFKEHRLVYPVLEPKVFKLGGGDRPVALFLFPWPWLSGKNGGRTPEYWKNMVESFGSIETPGHRRVFVGHMQMEGTHTSYGLVLPDSVSTFSYATLLRSACDSYFLGHIHNRQEYYVGTPWQLNHGEQDNSCGWELYDSLTGASTYYELDIGPRYYTVPIEWYEDVDFVKTPGHHVRVTGDRAPIRLLPGDVSQKTSAKAEKVSRTEHVDQTDLKALFQVWCKQKNLPSEDVLHHVPSHITSSTLESKNDLFSIKSVYLKNIGPHKELLWELEEDGWYGIFGPVGSGKSIILEAVMAALYNVFLHRGNVKHIATDDTAVIRVALTNSQGEFVWERSCKRGHWDAKVTKIVGGVRDELTKSNKQATILASELIANKQTLLWSCFSAQSGFKDKDGSRDIISADQSKRMDFLRSFLGLEVYDDLHADYIVKYNGSKEKLDRLRLMQDRLQEFRQAKQATESALMPINLDIRELGLKIKESKIKLQEEANKHTNLILEKSTELNSLVGQKQTVQDRYNSTRSKLENKFILIKKDYLNSLEAEKSIVGLPCHGLGENGGCLPCPLIENTTKIALNKEHFSVQLKEIKDQLENTEFMQKEVAEVKDLELQIALLNENLVVLKSNTDQTLVKLIKTDIADFEYNERKLLQSKGELDGKLVLINSNIEKMLEALEELEDVEAAVKGFAILVEAFSRTGISQLLIDQHLKDIQVILDDICENDFGGMFSVELSTVGQHQDSSEFETFAINCTKNGFTYPAEFCSGGELASIRIAFRIALILYQAKRNLGGLRVAFLDEPTAHQDELYTECTLKMLYRLKDYFNQVLVVSHDHQLQNLFSHKLLLG